MISGKRLDQFVGDDRAEQGCIKPPLLLLDIFAVLNRLNNAGVCARPADAKLLEHFHQARFGKPWRRLGEMLRRVDLDRPDRLLFRQLRQKLIFTADAGHFHEAVEDELAAGGAEDGVARLGLGDDRDGGLIELRRRHLRGDESPPDQVVETRVIVAKFGAGHFGGEPTSVGRIASWASCASCLRE